MSPTLSPDGEWIAYFADEHIRLVRTDGTADHELVDLTPLGGRDRHFAATPDCYPNAMAGCSYRPPLLSWTASATAPRSPVRRSGTLTLPSAQAPPSAGACPVAEAACRFATQVNQWARTTAVDAIIAASAPVTVSWPAQQVDPGGPFPLCAGSRAGEQRTGFAVGRLQSHTWLVSTRQYRDLLREWLGRVHPYRADGYGTGGIRLTSLG